MTVTGYIIPLLGEGTQPVFTLDRDWWQKRGQQNVADILETLPFATSNFDQTFAPGNNTSPGSDAVNLHAIGADYTLVLVDGLRFPLSPFPLGFEAPFVDLNSIPLAAVDRIEILKDNGTSTYGDDAVAGVINIILRDQEIFLIFFVSSETWARKSICKAWQGGNISSSRLDKTKSNVMDASTKSSRVSDGSMGGEARQFHTTRWILVIACAHDRSQTGRAGRMDA